MLRIAGRFGKLPVKHDPRTLRFAKYARAIAPPPASYSNLTRVYNALGVKDPTVLFPMDGNDTLGDCTWAGVAHQITVFNGLVGKKVIPDGNAVMNGYLAFDDGQDVGCNELDVLNLFRQSGMLGEKILAHVAADPKNHTHVQQAIQLFGGLYIGMAVTDTCQDQFSNGQEWTPGNLIPNEGHCVVVTDYDADGVTLLTWGNTQKANWAWWDECVDEAHVILPVEAQDKNFAPGFDLAQLQADLADVTN